ncbi:hypothetical protein JOM56_007360 [Amanita muscaria]
MDLDWCLHCNRHTDSSDVYCSDQCKKWAGPSSSVHHHRCNFFPMQSLINDDDEDYVYYPIADHSTARIRAWASAIPQGSPPGDTPPKENVSCLSAAPSVRSFNRPPKLLHLRRPVSPSISMSTSVTASPSSSQPIPTPQQQKASFHEGSTNTASNSLCRLSSLSSVTESSIATPGTTLKSPVFCKGDAVCQARLFRLILEKGPYTIDSSNPCRDPISLPDVMYDMLT